MERGWIKIYRKIQDNPLWNDKPFSRGQAWIDLLLLANHKENYIIARGIKVVIKRGQVGWSEVKLSHRWGWSRSKLRTFLNLLESEQQIEQQKNNVSLLITIINYSDHQEKGQQTEQQKDSKRTAKGQQKDTNKNDKNVKNDKKEDIYTIFNFWNSQGITKHKTIDKSKSSISAALKEYSEDEIKGAIVNYKKILDNSAYYWTHKWTLKEFLQRGMDKFRDENNPFNNYKADKKGGEKSGKHTGLNEKDYSEGIGADGSF